MPPKKNAQRVHDARREQVKELFLQKMTQRTISERLKLALPTVNHLIGEICEAFLKEARQEGTLGKVLIQLYHDREQIQKAAWGLYQATARPTIQGKPNPDFQKWDPSAAVQALKAIDAANASFVTSLTRLGIIEEAPQKVEHSGGVAVLVRTPLPERKALK